MIAASLEHQARLQSCVSPLLPSHAPRPQVDDGSRPKDDVICAVTTRNAVPAFTVCRGGRAGIERAWCRSSHPSDLDARLLMRLCAVDELPAGVHRVFEV